jgi:2-hydroxy-3-keto-5-methylthiopentenyl-1-phosphate phosphatase
MSLKEFTVADVAAHNKREDLYLIIRDEVYDLTKFAAEVRDLCFAVLKLINSCMSKNLFGSFIDLDFSKTFSFCFFVVAASR